MKQSQGRTIARNAGIVMVLILISRLLGFVRERAIADVFGLTWETDAFRAAFNIPDLMYFLLVGGAISSAFIPVFSEMLARGQEKDAWGMAATFINLVSVALLVLTIFGVIASPWLAPLVAPGFDDDQLAFLIVLMRDHVSCGLVHRFGRRRYGRAQLVSKLYHAAARTDHVQHRHYAGRVRPWTAHGHYGHGRRHRRRCHDQLSHASAFRRSESPSLSVAHQFETSRAAQSAETDGADDYRTVHRPAEHHHFDRPGIDTAGGRITALNLANRLVQLPLGVFGMGMSMVIFPVMSRLAAVGDMQQFRSHSVHRACGRFCSLPCRPRRDSSP